MGDGDEEGAGDTEVDAMEREKEGGFYMGGMAVQTAVKEYNDAQDGKNMKVSLGKFISSLQYFFH